MKPKISHTILAITTILVLLIILYFYNKGSITTGEFINTTLIVILVAATIFYADETAKMAKEMELTRKNDFLPYLKIRPTSYHGYFGLEIVNVGRGVAKDVEVSIKIEPSDIKSDSFYPYIYPREKENVLQPFLDKAPKINDIIEKFKFLRMIGKCRDILGDEYSVDDTFDIEKWRKTLHGKFIEHNPIEFYLEHIQRAIESIERKMK